MNNHNENVLSDEEREAFKELESRIHHEFGAEEADSLRINRFLRAREFNVNAAEAMFRKNVAWRKKEKMDTFIQDYEAPEIIKEYLPFYISGFSSEGTPIVMCQFGDTDLKGILKSVKKEAVLKHIAFLMEKCDHFLSESLEKLGKKLEKWIVVVNFENSTLFQVTNKACIDALLGICSCYETNYPERLEKAIIVNTTIYFNIIFNIMKNVLSPVTVNKVKTYGRDGWQEELQKLVCPKIFRILQGERKDDLGSNPNCITSFNYGGKVPKRYYSRSPERRLCFKEGVIKCVLKRNQKIDIPVDVATPKSFLEWKFETENYDIAFGLSYKKTCDVTEERKPLIPMQKFEADMGCEVGSYMCQEHGTYILTFDNTYSWFRQKRLFYSVSVVEPGEDDNVIGC